METKQELRAYFFQNMYLQGIHAGVQSQHTTVEMFVKYNPSKVKSLSERESDKVYMDCVDTLYLWANNHKTTIVLNGGMQGDLKEIVKVLDDENNPYPWARFHESQYALGGALTNVGIILPAKIYNAPTPSVDEPFFEEYCDLNHITEYEKQIINLVRSKRLF